jgi:hypothetical protein
MSFIPHRYWMTVVTWISLHYMKSTIFQRLQLFLALYPKCYRTALLMVLASKHPNLDFAL